MTVITTGKQPLAINTINFTDNRYQLSNEDGKSPLILVVDDESAVRSSIGEFLEDNEYRVVLAEDGRDAIAHIISKKPDLVVLDLAMPDVDGFEVLSFIKAEYGDMPVIAMSGGGLVEDAVKAIQFGAWDFLIKPIGSLSVLMHAIQKNLKQAQLARENQDFQRRLQNSKKKYKSLVENAGAAVTFFNSDFKIIYVNNLGTEIFGLPKQKLMGKSIDELFPPDQRQYLKQWFAKVMSERKGETFEDWVEFDGDKKCFLMNIQPVIDDGGQIDGVQYICSDITSKKKAEKQRKQLEAQLYQSEKMASIGQLAAGVAHEINNPIGYIGSNLKAMEKYLKKINDFVQNYDKNRIADIEEMITDFKDAIQESIEGADRVKKIVSDLTGFSRAESKKKDYADINKGIESTLTIVWNQLKYHCEIKKEYGDIPDVYCIPNQINQVFLNLLVNAGHAMAGKSGKITIKTWVDKDFVKISIKDNGCGISEENMKKIFEPFFTTKEVGKGTGLGLSLSYSIVKKHGGDIDVKSKVGEGTEFIISLPIKGGSEPEIDGAPEPYAQ